MSFIKNIPFWFHENDIWSFSLNFDPNPVGVSGYRRSTPVSPPCGVRVLLKEHPWLISMVYERRKCLSMKHLTDDYMKNVMNCIDVTNFWRKAIKFWCKGHDKQIEVGCWFDLCQLGGWGSWSFGLQQLFPNDNGFEQNFWKCYMWAREMGPYQFWGKICSRSRWQWQSNTKVWKMLLGW